MKNTISLKDIERLEKSLCMTISMSDFASSITSDEGDPVNLDELGSFADPTMDVEADLLRKEEAENLREMMQNLLTKTQIFVLSERYGLDGREKTLLEIGREIGLSRERVRQIEASALRKLRVYGKQGYSRSKILEERKERFSATLDRLGVSELPKIKFTKEQVYYLRKLRKLFSVFDERKWQVCNSAKEKERKRLDRILYTYIDKNCTDDEKTVLKLRHGIYGDKPIHVETACKQMDMCKEDFVVFEMELMRKLGREVKEEDYDRKK